MFNQKINGYLSENPDYLNVSYSAPQFNPRSIHTCGSTINKYTKNGCKSLPLQSWCSPNVAVESFGMRPINNPKEYIDQIKNYLASIIYTDSIPLNKSGLLNDSYSPMTIDSSVEPLNSFIQTIKLDLTNKLMSLLSESCNQVKMFKEINPLSEGFILTDIEIDTYSSLNNDYHFFHSVVFSAMNTTRYNTISFKATAYQDTTKIMDSWYTVISKIENNQNSNVNTSALTDIYISNIDLLNDTNCVIGMDSDCGFKGYSFDEQDYQQKEINWLDYPSLENGDGYTQSDPMDFNSVLPSDIDQLINKFKWI